MSRKEPQFNPDDPQRMGTESINSTDLGAINQVNGELNIEKIYPDTRPPVVEYDNPYTIVGGKRTKMNKYNFISKSGKFGIQGKNQIDALKNGLLKLESENRNIYNQKKQITVNLQKESNNRINKLHKFMIKIFRIDNPVYHYKIEIWEL
jgi:hypothetical protein